MRESMPLLLVEALDHASRELTHRHIESCPECSEEWAALKETWQVMGEVPIVEVPPRVRDRFLAEVMPAGVVAPSNVVPFQQRRWTKWLAQAAAVVLLAGGSYFAGHRSAPVTLAPQGATITNATPVAYIPSSQQQPTYSIAETRVLPAAAVSPNIEGRPDIENVQFVDPDASDGKISVAFDVTSHVTVTGTPTDKSMVRLLSYVLQSSDRSTPSRSRAIEWVRQTYSDPHNANPEIAEALARVLRNDDHQGARLQAVETLKTLPAAATEPTRDALIEALKSDPNPAVRIKAVEALARLASSGAQLDTDEVETLRKKAAEENENLYVRVKAAEALSKIH
jgi:hypothetical protein